MIIPYTQKIEESMKAHYNKLNEKDKRTYIAMESLKLWYGWKQYLVRLFKCSANRLARGLKELAEPSKQGIRLPWWWPKGKIAKNPEWIKAFDRIIKEYTAWSPVNAEITRTNLRPQEIVRKMKSEANIETSIYIVSQIMITKWFKKRKLFKGKTLKSVEGRNEQFENIKKIKDQAEMQWNPVISVDTKKKGDDMRVY